MVVNKRKRELLPDLYVFTYKSVWMFKKDSRRQGNFMSTSPRLGVHPREAEPLKELRIATSKHPRSFMSTTEDYGQLIGLLLRLINAKKTIELGVYTGYSLLQTAHTIPDDGQILAVDIDDETFNEIGLPVIINAGVQHKINFVKSPALEILDKLLDSPDNLGSFDFAYIDANKISYLSYHERLVKLVRVGGLLVYDNTLWGGSVAIHESMVSPEWLKGNRVHAIKFNDFIATDSRVQIAQVATGDGATICMRLTENLVGATGGVME